MTKKKKTTVIKKNYAFNLKYLKFWSNRRSVFFNKMYKKSFTNKKFLLNKKNLFSIWDVYSRFRPKLINYKKFFKKARLPFFKHVPLIKMKLTRMTSRRCKHLFLIKYVKKFVIKKNIIKISKLINQAVTLNRNLITGSSNIFKYTSFLDMSKQTLKLKKIAQIFFLEGASNGKSLKVFSKAKHILAAIAPTFLKYLNNFFNFIYARLTFSLIRNNLEYLVYKKFITQKHGVPSILSALTLNRRNLALNSKKLKKSLILGNKAMFKDILLNLRNFYYDKVISNVRFYLGQKKNFLYKNLVDFNLLNSLPIRVVTDTIRIWKLKKKLVISLIKYKTRLKAIAMYYKTYLKSFVFLILNDKTLTRVQKRFLFNRVHVENFFLRRAFYYYYFFKFVVPKSTLPSPVAKIVQTAPTPALKNLTLPITAKTNSNLVNNFKKKIPKKLSNEEFSYSHKLKRQIDELVKSNKSENAKCAEMLKRGCSLKEVNEYKNKIWDVNVKELARLRVILRPLEKRKKEWATFQKNSKTSISVSTSADQSKFKDQQGVFKTPVRNFATYSSKFIKKNPNYSNNFNNSNLTKDQRKKKSEENRLAREAHIAKKQAEAFSKVPNELKTFKEKMFWFTNFYRTFFPSQSAKRDFLLKRLNLYIIRKKDLYSWAVSREHNFKWKPRIQSINKRKALKLSIVSNLIYSKWENTEKSNFNKYIKNLASSRQKYRNHLKIARNAAKSFIIFLQKQKIDNLTKTSSERIKNAIKNRLLAATKYRVLSKIDWKEGNPLAPYVRNKEIKIDFVETLSIKKAIYNVSKIKHQYKSNFISLKMFLRFNLKWKFFNLVLLEFIKFKLNETLFKNTEFNSGPFKVASFIDFKNSLFFKKKIKTPWIIQKHMFASALKWSYFKYRINKRPQRKIKAKWWHKVRRSIKSRRKFKTVWISRFIRNIVFPLSTNPIGNYPERLQNIWPRRILVEQQLLRLNKLVMLHSKRMQRVFKNFKKKLQLNSSMSKKLRNFKILKYKIFFKYKQKLLKTGQNYQMLLKNKFFDILKIVLTTKSIKKLSSFYKFIGLDVKSVKSLHFEARELSLKNTKLKNLTVSILNKGFVGRYIYVYNDNKKCYEYQKGNFKLRKIAPSLLTIQFFIKQFFNILGPSRSLLPLWSFKGLNKSSILMDAFTTDEKELATTPWEPDIKFIKYFSSKNLDFSLIEIFNYRKSLNQTEFKYFFNYIILNNLIKIFKSTKSEKKFLLLLTFFNTLFLKIKQKMLQTRDIKLSFLKKRFLKYFNSTQNQLYFLSFQFIVNLSLNLKVQKWKVFFNKKYISKFFKSWLRNKMFRFWLTQEFERDWNMTFRISLINAVKGLAESTRVYKNSFKDFYNKIKMYRRLGKWRDRAFNADLLWQLMISVRYRCSMFLADVIAEQIVRRRKHWPFIKRVNFLINTVVKYYFKYGFRELHGLRIGVNGKINGKDRAINYLFYLKIKGSQISRIHATNLKVDYSFLESPSKYGMMGIRVWFSRI